jgi:mono/diheme cytochrome c family protein
MSKSIWLIIMVAGGFLLLPQSGAADQTVVIEKVPIDLELLGLREGAELYQGYCAVCHGPAAKGDGPAAPALEAIPTDLTHLTIRNGGKFPSLSVMHTISGRFQEAGYHSEMPAWEQVFLAATGDPLGSRLRVRNVTDYLESIQEPLD